MSFCKELKAELDAQFQGEKYDAETIRQLAIMTWRKLMTLQSTHPELPLAIPLVDYNVLITSPPDRPEHADISLVYATERGHRFLMAVQEVGQ